MNQSNISLSALYVLFALLFLTPLGIAWQKERDALEIQSAARTKQRFEAKYESLKAEVIASLAQNHPTFKESGIKAIIPKVKRGGTVTLPVIDESSLELPPGTSIILEDVDFCDTPSPSGMDVIEEGYNKKEFYWTISKDETSVAGEGYFDYQDWSVVPQTPFTEKGWEANIPPALEGQHPSTCTFRPRAQLESRVQEVEVTLQIHENAASGIYKYQLFAGVPAIGPSLQAGHTVIFEVF